MESVRRKTEDGFSQAQRRLAIAVLALAPFSFAPSLALPFRGFVSFRIGAYQLLLVLFAVAGLWLYRFNIWRELKVNRWLQLYAAGFGLVVVHSITVTFDLPRTLLLVASVGLLNASSLVMFVFVKSLSKRQTMAFLEAAVLWIVRIGLIVAMVGILQFVLGSFNQQVVPDGLCNGCDTDVFGFPRSNGFAAEPQFYANALLPATVIVLAQLVKRRTSNLKSRTSKAWVQARVWLVPLVLLLAFALAFSRGANLALAAGLTVLAAGLVYKKQYGHLLRVVGLVVVGYVLAGAMMVGVNWLQFRTENPDIISETIETLVEHGSAGVVELDIRKNQGDKGEASNVKENASQPADQMLDLNPQPKISGRQRFSPPQQVEASGNERTEAAKTGLAFLDTPNRILLGVGLGNLGPYAVSQDPGLPSNLTIYIQYALVLVETGAIGLALFVIVHAAAAWRCLKQVATDNPFQLALSAIMISFMVQYFFFGTYINAAYIWVYLGLCLGLFAGRTPTAVD